MNQILLGASFPFVIAVIIYFIKGMRAPFWMLVITPILMFLSSMWAVAPDLPRLLGMHDLYMRLSFDPRCDIFFWHYTIDEMESDSQLYTVLFVLMIMAILFAVWREIHLAEKEA